MAIDELAKASDQARAEFATACRSETITEAEFNAIRARYLVAMRAHHDALDDRLVRAAGIEPT